MHCNLSKRRIDNLKWFWSHHQSKSNSLNLLVCIFFLKWVKIWHSLANKLSTISSSTPKRIEIIKLFSFTSVFEWMFVGQSERWYQINYLIESWKIKRISDVLLPQYASKLLISKVPTKIKNNNLKFGYFTI